MGGRVWDEGSITDANIHLDSRQQQYRRTNADYRQRESKRSQSKSESQLWAKPFIGWDSEGDNRDRSIFLFGNSDGDRIAHPGISSVEMLDLILECEERNPDAWHIIFGGEYDFNMFLRDLPLRALHALRERGSCRWQDYTISHIPRKWFTVKRGKVTAKLFDIQLFFASSYVAAITEHQIGNDEDRTRIIEGKAQRQYFGYEHLAYIEPYWRTELRLLPLLAERLRESFYRAGMFITSWHGPGALARNILTNRGIKQCMKPSPTPVHTAARYAFAGGRFESFKAGLYPSSVYNADINSAYPYAATFLPDLTTGTWRHESNVDRSRIDATQFAVYRIRRRVPASAGREAVARPQPLFRRFPDDRVQWTNNVVGWYWSPEAALVADDPAATFLEAWVYEDVGTRPFKFLSEYYDHRRVLKERGDPMQLSFKLGPNSVYGQLAQRAGWEHYQSAPKFHQLEWAGYVTSMCRAMVYRTASYAWEHDGLVSIDTDGVYSTVPLPDHIFPTGTGNGLGQWETSSFPGVLYWQSGVFYVPDSEGEWQLKKSRGAPKGQIPYADAKTALETLSPIEYTRTEFIGYRLALKQSMDDWRYFRDRPRKIEFGGSSFSKRFHNPRACRHCRGDSSQQLHDLYPASTLDYPNPESVMHNLPWLDNDHERGAEDELLVDEIRGTE